MFPICEFEHLGETFSPDTEVPAGHRMVALRPDLFTADKPKPTRKPKE